MASTAWLRKAIAKLHDDEARRLAREILADVGDAPEPELTPLEWLAYDPADSRSRGDERPIDLAPITGTDARALRAIAQAWELYAYTRQSNALEAIRSLLACMQPSTRPLTKMLIARAMDWSDIARLWPLVHPDNETVRN